MIEFVGSRTKTNEDKKPRGTKKWIINRKIKLDNST